MVDSAKTAGKAITINLEVDGGEKLALVLRNSVLNHLAKPAANPDLTIRGTSAAIVATLMGGKPEQAIVQGTVKVEGRAAALSELLSMTTAPEFWFSIITRPAWKT